MENITHIYEGIKKGFVISSTPNHVGKIKRDKKKKPRHNKNKVKKEKNNH